MRLADIEREAVFERGALRVIVAVEVAGEGFWVRETCRERVGEREIDGVREFGKVRVWEGVGEREGGGVRDAGTVLVDDGFLVLVGVVGLDSESVRRTVYATVL